MDRHARKRPILESIVAACLTGIGVAGIVSPSGCNNSNRGLVFNHSAPNVSVGSLDVYFAISMDATEQKECTEAIQDHWAWFSTFYGLPSGNTKRVLQVYDVPMINSPWQLGQPGWADIDHPNIHVVKGGANETPDLLRQLVKSYWFPYVIYDQAPTAPPSALFWTIVRADQAFVNSSIKARRPWYP